MDELHDAIQDAQYIGAVTNAQRGPTAAFYTPTPTELSQFLERQERTLGTDWLCLENILDQPLGFYFFRRFCETENHGVPKLQFLVEVTKYRGIKSPEQRSQRAKEIWDRFNSVSAREFTSGTSNLDPGISTIEPMPGSNVIAVGTTDTTVTGQSVSPRHSLVSLRDINVAVITNNGVVFWRKSDMTMTRTDVVDLKEFVIVSFIVDLLHFYI